MLTVLAVIALDAASLLLVWLAWSLTPAEPGVDPERVAFALRRR